jgi:uncharacterized membrane protein YGL010W
MEIFLVLWIVFSVLAGRYAKRKGFGFAATFVMSLIISPLIGFASVAVRKPVVAEMEREALATGEVKKCPACAELVKFEASKCRFCGEALAS